MAMFRNVNVAPIDTSGFERAGAAYGQMFQNLGNTVAQTIQKYEKKKEEKADLEDQTQFWTNQINPQTGENFKPDVAKALAKNPALGPAVNDINRTRILVEAHALDMKTQADANLITEGVAAYISGKPVHDYEALRFAPVMPQIKQKLEALDLGDQLTRAQIKATEASAQPKPVDEAEFDSAEEASPKIKELRDKGFDVETVTVGDGVSLKISMSPDAAVDVPTITGMEDHYVIGGSVYEKTINQEGEETLKKISTTNPTAVNQEMLHKIIAARVGQPDLKGYADIKSAAINPNTAERDGFYLYISGGQKLKQIINEKKEAELSKLAGIMDDLIKGLVPPAAPAGRFEIIESN